MRRPKRWDQGLELYRPKEEEDGHGDIRRVYPQWPEFELRGTIQPAPERYARAEPTAAYGDSARGEYRITVDSGDFCPFDRVRDQAGAVYEVRQIRRWPGHYTLFCVEIDEEGTADGP